MALEVEIPGWDTIDEGIEKKENRWIKMEKKIDMSIWLWLVRNV